MLAPMAGAAVGALVLADVLSGGLRRLALWRGLTDDPGLRKAHARPMPYLGGVAIALGTLIPVAVLVPHWDVRLGVLVIASAAVAAVGLVDDLRCLSPVPRLVTESLAAMAVVLIGGRIAAFGNWLDLIVTTLWIVVITNSFNLLDNMDGAAATVATVVAGFLAWAAFLTGQTGLVLFLLALSAGCFGFLIHNWTPARMFMGDAGSLFIGFVISAGAVLIDLPGGPMSRIAEMLLVTFVATVDTCLVLLSRRRAGRSLLVGGTDHISHRLRRLGMSIRQVTFTLFAATLVPCLFGVLVTEQRLSGSVAVVGVTVVALSMIWLLLRVPVYPAERTDFPVRPISARALSTDRS
ncbi:glycosyltransferase family 4 protein [Actinomadura sp. HBU206391]|uniref:glycosyltransferase family 4 protein n=1 Tax=Actinomadura sp. HBU206391 TaxID=2731692 RepID=UPI0021C5D408|nr:MraY family glycosyltransferase [Actinomadura sp. HBU206391]